MKWTLRSLALHCLPPACLLIAVTPHVPAQAHILTVEPIVQERIVGPYDVHVLQGGAGLTKAIPAASQVLTASGPATLSAWVLIDPATPATTLLFGLGDPKHEDSRLLGLEDRRRSSASARITQSPQRRRSLTDGTSSQRPSIAPPRIFSLTVRRLRPAPPRPGWSIPSSPSPLPKACLASRSPTSAASSRRSLSRLQC